MIMRLTLFLGHIMKREALRNIVMTEKISVAEVGQEVGQEK